MGQRRWFTDDYKRQAVDLVASSGRSIVSLSTSKDGLDHQRRCVDATDANHYRRFAGGTFLFPDIPWMLEGSCCRTVGFSCLVVALEPTVSDWTLAPLLLPALPGTLRQSFACLEQPRHPVSSIGSTGPRRVELISPRQVKAWLQTISSFRPSRFGRLFAGLSHPEGRTILDAIGSTEDPLGLGLTGVTRSKAANLQRSQGNVRRRTILWRRSAIGAVRRPAFWNHDKIAGCACRIVWPRASQAGS